MLVVDLAGLGIVHRQAQLVDYFGPHGNPFPPAVGANLLVDFLGVRTFEGQLRQARFHLMAAGSGNLSLADGNSWNGGRRLSISGTGTPKFRETHADHFGSRHHLAAFVGAFDALGQSGDRFVFAIELQQRIGLNLIRLADIGIQRQAFAQALHRGFKTPLPMARYSRPSEKWATSLFGSSLAIF